MTAQRELAVAVVGLGFGRNHARVLHEMPGARLAAICDKDTERLASVAAGRGVRTYTDHREMLHNERLDAVIVAVPTRLHFTVASDCIAAGLATMIEKPIAPTLGEGKQLIEMAETAGVPLMHGHIERFNPAVQELLRRVRAGEAGRIIQIVARRLAYFSTRSWQPDPNSSRSREFDIGVVHDLGIHEIDIMRLVAAAEVDRAYAETLVNVRTPFEDSLNGTLRFQAAAGEQGIIGTLEVHRLSTRMVRELTVLGDRGEFIVDYQAQTLTFRAAQSLHETTGAAQETPVVSLQGDEPGAPVSIPVTPQEPLLAELSAWVEALRSGSPTPVSNADAVAALAIADALTESGRSGRAVTP